VTRSEEQAARNESVFREANEAIAARRAELESIEGSTPFLCECEDEACTELVRLTTEEYEAVRAVPNHFVVVRGHEAHDETVVREGEGWVCVAKDGAAGAIARETDPRGET
jgi:hypothetical protein